MSDGARDLLIRGIAAAKANDIEEARRYLERALNNDPDPDQRVQACLYLNEISSDPAEARGYLEDVLAFSPGNAEARRRLAILDGRLKPTEVVDPDRLTTKTASEPVSTSADRFTCPRCGGRMTYTPDGSSLMCEYCESRQRLHPPAGASSGTQEDDFILAMATARGHLRPVQQQTFTCGGCGASFLLPPEKLSLTCPYCGSTYVISQPETRELIAPTALIPFVLDSDRAENALAAWLARIADGLQTPKLTGMYTPAWLFDLGGELGWRARRYDNNRREWVEEEGTQPLLLHDILVPASSRLPEPCAALLYRFDLGRLVPYDERYLADWPAETYQIALGDASLSARQLALNRQRERIQSEIPFAVHDLVLDSSRMTVETYRLALLPLWLGRYQIDGTDYPLVVNGQTGEVGGSRPAEGLGGWLKKALRSE
jgi:DNA-directed RNA polymerase subunit RPC12/RpoP